jgi:hypothetical protein
MWALRGTGAKYGDRDPLWQEIPTCLRSIDRYVEIASETELLQ